MVGTIDGVKKWTVTEVERMAELGFPEDPHHYELIEGQILEKVSANDPHFFGLMYTVEVLRQVYGSGQAMAQQAPLKFSEFDAPEPDIAFLTRRTSRPKSGEVLLVVEVADTSRGRDLGLKARIYARHGVREYWVLDLPRRRMVVHRGPHPETEDWAEIREVPENGHLAPLDHPEAAIPMTDLLRGEEPD